MRKGFVVVCVAAAVVSGAIVACVSSNPAGPAADGGGPGEVDAASCVPEDASLSAVAASLANSGLCSTCVQSECASLITGCSADCTCNDQSLQVISCIEKLGSTASVSTVTACVAPAINAADPTLSQLASCLAGCAGPCGVPDAAGCGDACGSTEDAGDAAKGSCNTTTISGTVYDPAGKNPLPGVTVYVPSGPLVSLTRGVPTGANQCSCSALQTPYVGGTVTDAEGRFSLSLPATNSVSLVVQTGKWRKAFPPMTVTPCGQNNAGSLSLPQSIPVGDSDDSMPDIAVSTGGADTLECLLTRMGIAGSEYVPGNSAAGHVHIFLGGNMGGTGGPDAGLTGLPEKNAMPDASASSTTLWDQLGDMTPYDIVMLSCEGAETYGANPTVLEGYLNVGGRVLASHYHYAWFSGALVSGQEYEAPLDWGNNLATWTGGPGFGDGGSTTQSGAIPQQSLPAGGVFAKGARNQSWLNEVGALTASEVTIDTPRFNASVTASNAHSYPWLRADNTSGAPGAATLFTFGAPVNTLPLADGGPPPYCGRAAYTDLHVDTPLETDSENVDGGKPPPLGCSSETLTPQEKELELVFFDLSSCVVSDTAPLPTTPPSP